MANIEVKFENVPANLQAEIKRLVVEIPAVLRMSFQNKWGADYREKWFGERDTVPLLNMLSSVDKYLNDKCTRLTFVKVAGGHYGAVWPTVVAENETVDDFKKGMGYLLVPSGQRIDLADAYITPETESSGQQGGESGLYTVPLQRVNTIFHEMTHKILKTDDVVFPGTNTECYGETLCKDLRTLHPSLAINNADNWGFYIAECFKKVF